MSEKFYYSRNKHRSTPKNAWSRHKSSPVAKGGFGGLSPSKQSSKPPKLKYETLYISGIFVKFECQDPPAHTSSPPAQT